MFGALCKFSSLRFQAQYEEFWHRYAMYLQSKGDMDRTFNVFVRAATLFLHPRYFLMIKNSRAKIRLSYSAFLEEIGQVDEARGVFTGFLKASKFNSCNYKTQTIWR